MLLHLFCEVHQTLLQQCTPPTCCCHPRASRLGWCSSACKSPPFSSKHNDGHYGQTVLFLFHQTRGHFSKEYNICPHVQLQTVLRLFLGQFWSSGFFLAHTRFFSSAHTFSIGLRSGLRDGHSNTLTLMSLSHFATTLEVCLGSLSIWKVHLQPSFNFLTDVLRCCFNIST